MESGTGGASNKDGDLVPVSVNSDAFQKNILAPLKSAYLFEESKQSFRYKSAVLIKNPSLENKYNAFRAKRREAGYSEEDLKESYGFLLFDDVNRANKLGEAGVLTGNGTCTTLGDPSKGVYISMYSDCLDLNRWYHGKSGYIAIIRLTKGRVNKVLENYTQNLTAPTEGFDCHVSEQLPSVSAQTSSFLAFERTQYYMYELLDDGSNETAQSPSAAFPIAIVSFSYTDSKATVVEAQENSEEKKLVCHYSPWRGQLQIGTHFYDVGLRSTAGALIPAKLPPEVKVDRAISMLDLRQLLPRAVFETCFSGEVFLDGLYCSLYEVVSSEAAEASSLSLLLLEIKEKDIALIIPLNDGGFLVLLHSSHFLTYDDSGSSATEVLQGLFVFPDSRVLQRDTKFGQRKPVIPSEILRILPVLSYAEGEVEKTPTGSSEELCEVYVQHMQSYAALINPGFTSSPSRDISIFPDQYDVPDAHKHLYSSPEWTNRAWQNFKSYLSKPVSFQLPVSKVSEILAAGQEDRIEDLDDDVYFCLSSPEEASANHVGMGSRDPVTGQKSALNDQTSVESCITSAEAQVDLKVVAHNAVPSELQAGSATKDTEKSDLIVLIKTDDMGTKNLLTPSTSDDLPAELIVSITSAEQTVTDASLSVISTESAAKHNDFPFSSFSTDKLQTAGVNSLNDETVEIKKDFDRPELTNTTKTKRRKPHRGHSKGQKQVSESCIETSSSQAMEIQLEDDNIMSQKEDHAMEPSCQLHLSRPSNIDWRKVRRRKRVFGKLSSKQRKLRSATIGVVVAGEKKSDPGQQSFKSTVLMEPEACPLRKKTERWDLKPVISECGRILVPHGSVDIADQIKTLNDKLQSTKDEQCPQMLVEVSGNAHDTVKAEQESRTDPETALDETTTSSKGGENLLPDLVDPEHRILRKSDDCNDSLILDQKSSEQSIKNDDIFQTIQEEQTDSPSRGKSATKGELLLNKLKSVLQRGKRKTGILVPTEKAADTTQGVEPCLKKGKVDSDSGMLKSNDAVISVKDTNVDVKEVTKMVSVDPVFAYALGLTPKETPDMRQKSEGQDTRQRKDLSETEGQTMIDKQPQIIQRPLSIFPRRSRIKTLKKHQGISEECVKKKWWLHFQTPACFASEKLKCKEFTRDISVRKTVKEKSSSACSSTDALNLLADLALSASNDQVPPQPDNALERKPETSLKKCDLTKDVTSAEQESVLHALLRQPAARPIQPLESPSPSRLMGGSELVDLVSKEHDYSLPPSSSLLLGLSGAPFPVSPISGSTRLLHHHQTMYGNGIKTLHPSVDQEDRSSRRRKFRNSRTFVNKNGSVQVTKLWKENYDFNLDSKFTSDSKDKSVIRALHGPWDFSIQDTNEEVRLIFHMWIGLFYSRSTARFFHVDSNCTNPCSEESDSLEMSSAVVPVPAQSEFEANSFGLSNIIDTSETLISKVLDLRKKDNSVLDQGPVILDLSVRSSSAEIVTPDPQIKKKETSVSGEQREARQTLETLEPSVGLQKGSTLQCYSKSAPSIETISKANDVRGPNKSKMTCASWQMAGHLEHTDIPSFKSGGRFISVQKEMENVSVKPGNHQITAGVGHVFHGCNNEKTDVKDDIENSRAAELSLVKEWEGNSAKPVTDKEVDSIKKTGDVVDTTENETTESKNGENWKMKEKSCLEGNIELPPKMIHAGDDSTNQESGIVCNGNFLENEKYSSREEPKGVSPGKAENVFEDVDCGTVHADKVVKDDHFGKRVGLDQKDCCISDDSDLNDLPLPIICDGPDLAKKDCITECNSHAPLDEQPSQADTEEDLCVNRSALTDQRPISEAQSEMEPIHNEPAVEENSENNVCMTDLSDLNSALTDEHTIAEKAPQSPSEMELIRNEPAVEENSGNCVCMADLSDHPLPMTFDGPDSVKKNSITECNPEAQLDEQTPHEGNEEEARHESQLRKLCANSSAVTDDHTIAEKAFQSPSEMELIHNEPAVEENSGNYVCSAYLSDHPLPMVFDGPDSVKKNCITECNTQAPFDKQPTQVDNEDTKSVEGKQNVDNTRQKEQFHHQSHSPQCELATKCKPEVVLTKETDKTSKGLGKIHGRVVIPFIGIDTSGGDAIQPHDSEGEVEEDKSQKEIPFIRETTFPKIALPTGACSTSQKVLNVRETNQPQVSESESDDRCPTPTMDEEPYQYVMCTSPTTRRSPAFTGSETCKNKSKVNSDCNPHHSLPPDLQLRTLRVLQSIDKFLPLSSHTDKSSQIKTVDMKQSLARTPNMSSKNLSTCSASNHTSAELTVESVPTSQDLCTKSSGHFVISPFKTKLEEILGVRMQLKHTDSSIQQHYLDRTDQLQDNCEWQNYCHPHRSFPSTECLLDTKPNIDQDRHKTTPQTSLSHESRLYNPRPVMAVKPSKNDEIQADCISKDRETENSVISVFSQNKPTKAPVVTYNTPAPTLFENKSESLKGNSAEVNDDQQEASELSSKTSWSLNAGDSKSNLDRVKVTLLEPLYQYEVRDISKFNKICSSSPSVQSFECAKTSSNLGDGNQSFLTNSLLENVGHTTKEIIEMDQKDCSEASTSAAYYKDESITDDTLSLGPQSTLTCTVYNTSRKRSHSFLEQLSQRCLQDDLTQSSMEQECLIFSEQMKQLLKRNKREHTHQLDAHDKLNLSFSSPLSVHFSSLEEQEDLVDHLGAPSLVGQKIKVDMSDRKDLAGTTEEEDALHSQKLCEGTGNPVDHAGVSAVSAECARLYTAMMNDACAVKRVPSKHFKKDKGYVKTEPSNHFDFCDQMKREMDESFRNDLNSVVKKSCKTKYRFFILSTSDDAFFEETKAQLEAEGHTAVQPSEFFLAEDGSSSLLIILRNEDIAEHICEVPHLLELKKSSDVQFAGIDEPDDVVNLTHQELFMRGGFIMFDRATLESLSLCNMKKMSEILQELSRSGKWKWMLHYRDSRRLKENARLSAEAKEKKHFFNWCQEVGILDIMPYHECDLMSKDQPDYLTCMIRLQVQTISARYPVFITDTTTDEAYGKNGILTMSLCAFLTCSPSETFTV